MPRIKVSTNASAVWRVLKQFGEDVVNDAYDQIYVAMCQIRDKMAIPGDPISGHLKWASLKQGRAYFRTEGFGKGIPYHRTNRYIKGWRVERSDNGSVVFNNVPYASAVGGGARGEKQQPMYEGRWPLFRDVVDQVIALLPKNILAMLRKRAGKIPREP
jgi:hypothetical protein